MPKRDRDEPASHLPLQPVAFHALLALADGPKHGYRILKEIEGCGEARLRLGPATLYDTLHRLRRQRLVETAAEPPEAPDDDRRRRYYRLTALGARVLAAEAERLRDLVRLAVDKRVVTTLRAPLGVAP